MTGRRSSTAVGIGGGSGDASGVSRSWVEENYVSKGFLASIATPKDNSLNPIEANDIQTTVARIDIAASTAINGHIFATGDYLLMSSGKSKYGLMVESTSWGENRDCAFGFHAATSGHDIAWSTRSGNNDICLDLVIDPNNTVAKRYTRVYDALCIGDGMIVWDSANNALKVIKMNGDAANFYATGGVSALGSST